MGYKTILVHVDGSPHALERMRVAADLAALADGHIVGAAMTGISRYMFASMEASSRSPEAVMPYIADHSQRLRERAMSELDRFDEQMRAAGAVSFERRVVEDENFGGLTLQSRYADLTVLSQFDADEPAGNVYAELPEIVAMESGRPVLVLPSSGAERFRPIGGNVLLAWDAGLEATRAVHHAIPLLQAARKARVVVFNARAAQGQHGDEPGADVALYLARHGINVEVAQETAGGDIGSALISRCADFQADLLVIGCYGHSRFREIMLGGVSRTVLASATVPVLMAH